MREEERIEQEDIGSSWDKLLGGRILEINF